MIPTAAVGAVKAELTAIGPVRPKLLASPVESAVFTEAVAEAPGVGDATGVATALPAVAIVAKATTAIRTFVQTVAFLLLLMSRK